MPTFGLIVEGEYDRAVLTELIQKCFEGTIDVIPRLCAQTGSLMKKFAAYLKELLWANQGKAVDKALVIRDADGRDSQNLLARMHASIVNQTYLFPVKFVIIVQELEAWLLADHEALMQVTGRRMSEIHESPEEITNPKERLRRILSGARVPYTGEVARRIAAAANLDRLEYRCPSFRMFRQAVQDC